MNNPHGYIEMDVPLLVAPHCLYGTGQLPKFADDYFQMEGDRELLLIPTAEVSLANVVREEVLDVSQLLRHPPPSLSSSVPFVILRPLCHPPRKRRISLTPQMF